MGGVLRHQSVHRWAAVGGGDEGRVNTSPREEYEKYLREGKLKERKLARKWYVTEDSLQVYFEQPEEPEEG